MKRAFLVLGLAMASLLSMGQADAAFVLIDNFYELSTGSAAMRGVSTTATFADPGVMTFDAGDTLSYSGLDAVVTSASGLSGLTNTTIRLNGINAATGVNVTLLATATSTVASGSQSRNTFETVTGALSNGFLEFTFANLDPNNLESLSFSSFGSGTFTANGIYAIPEPATLSLIGLASCGGLIGFRRRRTAVVA